MCYLRSVLKDAPMRLKSSAYNFFYPSSEGGVLYNGRTGAALCADPATSAAIAVLLATPQYVVGADSNLWRVREILRKQSFLVDESCDEVGEVLAKRVSRQRLAAGLSLTIAPTLACNFRCVYCYEDHPVGVMDDATALALLAFVAQRLPQGTALHVTWFGGEPLLAVDRIAQLTEGLIRLCDDRGCSYETFMITNGYRLDGKMAERLRALHVGDFQITIDGERDVHDRQRPLAGGQGTFDILMRNLAETAPHVSSITVRINLLRSNVDSATLLVRRLQRMQEDMPALGISLGQVDKATDHCGMGEKDLLDPGEFAAIQNALLGQSASCTDAVPDASALPTPFDTVCGADKPNAFVIGPNGDIFKCWNSLGRPTDSIGNISGVWDDRSSDWMRFQPSDDPQCRACKYLPICQGGCPDVQLRTHGEQKYCTPLRHTLREQLLKWAARQREPAQCCE
jgi:uncharacterized protein